MGQNSVLFLYSKGAHSVHRGWAEAVDADFMEVEPGWKGFLQPRSLKIRKYDVVLCENSYSMRLAAFHKALGADFHLSRLIATATYYNRDKKDEGLKGGLWAAKKADSAIAISKWVKKYAEKYFDCKIKVVNPFVTENKYEDLAELDYKSGTGNILLVGTHRRKEGSRKGLDYLEKAVSILEDKGYDIKAKTAGNSGEAIGYSSNVEDQGYVDHRKFLDLFEESELFLQPSRTDGWSVAVVEAMRSGTPPIVSENTGSKVLVEEVDENLVHELSAESLAESIEYFLDLSDDEKMELSEKFREISEEFSPSEKKKKFRESFQKLVKHQK
jgi:glycosyltransferase involved in cell wall biosynthesis